MDNGENTDSEKKQGEHDTGAPLPTAAAPSTADANQPHGNNVQNAADQEEGDPEHWFQNPDWWMVILTSLTVIVAAITLRVFFRQFQEMQTQTRILNTQAQEAASDAVEAAKRVEQQLQIGRRQAKSAENSVSAITKEMRQDQRPWMMVVEDANIFTVGEPVKMNTKIINTGKTAALRVTAVSEIQRVDSDKPPLLAAPLSKVHPHQISYSTGIIFPNGNPPFNLPGVWISPNATFANPAPETLTDDVANQYMGGKIYFALIVRVRYEDVFGTKHWTHYCSILHPPKGTWNYGKCTEYNRVDSN